MDSIDPQLKSIFAENLSAISNSDQDDSDAEIREKELVNDLDNTFASVLGSSGSNDGGDLEISETESVSHHSTHFKVAKIGSSSQEQTSSSGSVRKTTDNHIDSDIYKRSIENAFSAGNSTKMKIPEFQTSWLPQESEYCLTKQDHETNTDPQYSDEKRELRTAGSFDHLSKYLNSDYKESSEKEENFTNYPLACSEQQESTVSDKEISSSSSSSETREDSVFANLKMSSLQSKAIKDANFQEWNESENISKNIHLACIEENEKLKKTIQTLNENLSTSHRILNVQIASMSGTCKEKDKVLEMKRVELLKYEELCNRLRGELNAIKIELMAEKTAKQELQYKMESAGFTISALGSSNAAFARADTVTQFKEQHKKLFNDLKQRHKEEILELKKDKEKLSTNLQLMETELMQQQENAKKIHQEYEKFRVEKTELINQLHVNIKESQQQCQLLLESGKVTECNRLRLQIKQLEVDNCDLAAINGTLREQIANYKMELDARIYGENLNAMLNDAKAKGDGHKTEELSAVYNEIINAKKQLLETLALLEKEKITAESLKTRLLETEKEALSWKQKSNQFEEEYEEIKKKLNEVELKLHSVLPMGSISVIQHNQKILSLQTLNEEIENELKEVKLRLEEVSKNEADLNERNRLLRADLATIVSQHDKDKKEWFDRYTRNSSEELNKLRQEHQREVELLQEKIQTLNEELQSLRESQLVRTLAKEKLEREIKKNLEEEIKQKLKEGELELEKTLRAQLLIDVQKELENELKPQMEENIKLQLQNEIQEKLEKEMAIKLKKSKIKLKNELHAKIEKEENKKFEEKLKEKEKEYKNFEQQWVDENLQSLQVYKETITKDYDALLNQFKEKNLAEMAKEKQELIKFYEQKLNEKTFVSQKEIECQTEENMNSNELRIRQLKKTLEQKYQERLNEEIKDHKIKVSSLKEDVISEYENKLLQEKLKCEKLLKEQENEHENLFNRVKISIQQKWEEEKARMILDFNKKIDETNQFYNQYVQEMENNHKKIVDDFETKIEQLSSDTNNLKLNLYQNIEDLEKQYSQKMNNNKLELKKSEREKLELYTKLGEFVENLQKVQTEVLNYKSLVKKSDQDKAKLLQEICDLQKKQKIDDDLKPKTKFHSTACQTKQKLITESDVLAVKNQCMEVVVDVIGQFQKYQKTAQNKAIEAFQHCFSTYCDIEQNSIPLKDPHILTDMSTKMSSLNHLILTLQQYNNDKTV